MSTIRIHGETIKTYNRDNGELISEWKKLEDIPVEEQLSYAVQGLMDTRDKLNLEVETLRNTIAAQEDIIKGQAKEIDRLNKSIGSIMVHKEMYKKGMEDAYDLIEKKNAEIIKLLKKTIK